MSVKTAVHVYGLTGIVVAGFGAKKDQQWRDVGGPPLALLYVNFTPLGKKQPF